jgi:hypothetical protein
MASVQETADQQFDPSEQQVAADADQYSPESIEFCYTELQRLFDVQFAQVDALDRKAASLTGAAGVVISIMGTGILFSTALGTHLLYNVLAGVAVLSLLYCIRHGIVAIRLQVYERVPKPERLWERYVSWTPHHARYSLLGTAVWYFDQNRALIGKKARHMESAQIGLCAGMAIVVVLILLRSVETSDHPLGDRPSASCTARALLHDRRN